MTPEQASPDTVALANIKLNDGEASRDSFVLQTLDPSLKTNGAKSTKPDTESSITGINKIHVLVVEVSQMFHMSSRPLANISG